MQILLSCAKDMATKPITFPNQRANEPHFIAAAKEIAAEMMNFSTEELEETLKINSKLANQNWLRYQHFLQAGDTSHAALAFTGMAYNQFQPRRHWFCQSTPLDNLLSIRTLTATRCHKATSFGRLCAPTKPRRHTTFRLLETSPYPTFHPINQQRQRHACLSCKRRDEIALRLE